MSAGVPKCRTVAVHTFRGDHGVFGRRVRKALDDDMNGIGPGPSRLDCLLYAGHTGVSTDTDKTIYGFNPEFGRLPIWQGMQLLRNGIALPGVVLDDTLVFSEAKKHRSMLLTFDVVLPDPVFKEFQRKLTAERRKSQFAYGFPNGDGDCNFTTWLERLALPLLSGSMDEFVGLPGFRVYRRRRFGQCI